MDIGYRYIVKTNLQLNINARFAAQVQQQVITAMRSMQPLSSIAT
jgi:hypothetical protein